MHWYTLLQTGSEFNMDDFCLPLWVWSCTSWIYHYPTGKVLSLGLVRLLKGSGRLSSPVRSRLGTVWLMWCDAQMFIAVLLAHVPVLLNEFGFTQKLNFMKQISSACKNVGIVQVLCRYCAGRKGNDRQRPLYQLTDWLTSSQSDKLESCADTHVFHPDVRRTKVPTSKSQSSWSF